MDYKDLEKGYEGLQGDGKGLGCITRIWRRVGKNY